MAGLLDLNRRGAFGDGPVLYWHTYKPPTAASSGSATGLNPTKTEAKPRSLR